MGTRDLTPENKYVPFILVDGTFTKAKESEMNSSN